MSEEQPLKSGRCDAQALARRHLRFAVGMIDVVNRLPRTAVGRHVAGQLLRAGTSPGANYEEACGAESRADFVHKLGVVLKELKESRYWLHVILEARLLPAPIVDPWLQECQELCAITAKSVLTAKSQHGSKE